MSFVALYMVVVYSSYAKCCCTSRHDWCFGKLWCGLLLHFTLPRIYKADLFDIDVLLVLSVESLTLRLQLVGAFELAEVPRLQVLWAVLVLLVRVASLLWAEVLLLTLVRVR